MNKLSSVKLDKRGLSKCKNVKLDFYVHTFVQTTTESYAEEQKVLQGIVYDLRAHMHRCSIHYL